MKLSISNIAWQFADDDHIYKFMRRLGYYGLEIAPTRLFPENPYMQIERARKWAEDIYKNYGFKISSIQSIWYGRREKLFGTVEERQILIDYTKKAIDFAEAIGCRNLVFGCPGNRRIMGKVDTSPAIPFFREIGKYALDRGTVIALEANPPIYNTNYINDTLSAIKLVEEVDSAGFLLNLDIGTMIENSESVEEFIGYVRYINHIHISEPGLRPIVRRRFHHELRELLIQEQYQGFVSIEMAGAVNMDDIKASMEYVREMFY